MHSVILAPLVALAAVPSVYGSFIPFPDDTTTASPPPPEPTTETWFGPDGTMTVTESAATPTSWSEINDLMQQAGSALGGFLGDILDEHIDEIVEEAVEEALEKLAAEAGEDDPETVLVRGNGNNVTVVDDDPIVDSKIEKRGEDEDEDPEIVLIRGDGNNITVVEGKPVGKSALQKRGSDDDEDGVAMFPDEHQNMTIIDEKTNMTIVINAPLDSLAKRGLDETMYVPKEQLMGDYEGKDPAEAREQLNDYFKQGANIVDTVKPALQPPRVLNAVDMAYVVLNSYYYVVNRANPPEIDQLVADMPADVEAALKQQRDEAQQQLAAIDAQDYRDWQTDVFSVTRTVLVDTVLTLTDSNVPLTVTRTGPFTTATETTVTESAFEVKTQLEAQVTGFVQDPADKADNDSSGAVGSLAPRGLTAAALAAAAVAILLL